MSTNSERSKQESSVTLHKGGGFTVAGPDATQMFRVGLLKSGIRLYAKCGIIPTRGVTITKMMAMATEYTGQKYKRGPAEYERAAADLDVWFSTMQSAIPYEDNRSEEEKAQGAADYERTRRASEK